MKPASNPRQAAYQRVAYFDVFTTELIVDLLPGGINTAYSVSDAAEQGA